MHGRIQRAFGLWDVQGEPHMTLLSRFSVNFAVLSLLADVGLTLLSLRMAAELRDILPYGPDLLDLERVPSYVYVAAALIWLIVFVFLSVYNPRRRLRFVDEIQQVVLALILSGLCLAGFIFFAYQNMSRYLFGYFFIADVVFLIGWRLVYRVVRRLGRERLSGPRQVLIVGAGVIGQRTAETIIENEWAGLHLVGFVDDDTQKQQQAGPELPVWGTLAETEAIVQELHIDEVILALPLSAYAKVVQLSQDLQKHAVNVRVIPDYFSVAMFRASVEDVGGMPLINLRAPALNDYERFVKRIFDLIVGGLTLLVMLPIMLVISILIRLDSPGQVIYRQQRVGENGRLFWMLKFRTMVSDADERLSEVIHEGEDGVIDFKRPDDPRVTQIGRFLRRTSLDELPQLFNVLKGEMSLVGPRPELPWLVDRYELWQRKRFAVPQGMTGWWQINGRSNRHMHLSTQDDLYYIQNYSLLLDLRILFKTVGAVLRRRGAF